MGIFDKLKAVLDRSRTLGKGDEIATLSNYIV